MEERNAISVHLYEKYLVYGVAFGIPKEALKEMKVINNDYTDLELKDADDKSYQKTFDNLIISIARVEDIMYDIFDSMDLIMAIISRR